MIEIDGSLGEGGGQVLRSSLSLSLLTGKAFKLFNIRARRKPKSGLQPQHLMSVRAAATIGSAKTAGASIGSSVLDFEPGPVAPGKYRFDIGTAGATSLVLHTVYLPLAWNAAGPSEVVLTGGTHVMKSPCFHFLDTTWRAYLARIGLKIRLEMKRPGFYPRGGGEVVAHIQPCSLLEPLKLTKRPAITRATGFSAVAGLPDHIARRQARRAVELLKRKGIVANIEQQDWEGGPSSVLGIVFNEAPIPTFFYGLGERGKPAEAVADDAAEEALAYAESEAPIDPHSADQLILPLVFADGSSEYRVSTVTQHLLTNIEIVKRFIDREITCEGEEGSPGIVRVGNKL
jgi:RNA 3'-terminal phosphate cyclase (ATP)